MIAGTYNAGLVVLSVLIAIVASYAAFNLAERVSASGGQRRWAWLTGGAFAMGLGIWSMHYVGMLAFVLPVPVLYHIPTVILSLVSAVVGAAIALYIVSKKTMRLVDTAIVGACLGGAIVSMHYVGMAAMRSAAMHHYRLGLVILSVAVAVTFSFLAAWFAFRFGKSDQGLTWTKISAASLMGVGIASMHYTAMAAAYFILVPGYVPLTRATVEVSTLGALGIGMTTLLLLATTLVTMWFDRRLANQRLLQQLYTNLQEREAKIRRLVDANIIGIFMWDLEGQILEANDAFLRMVGYTRDELVSGRLRWKDLTPAEWHNRDDQAVAEMRATGTVQPYEKEYLRKDGSRMPVLVGSASFAETGEQGVAFLLDLTDRKRAEEALRASEQLARSHVEVMMRSLDVLATEAAPEKFIAEMLRTIGQRLHAHSVLLWLRNPEDDSLRLRLAIDDGQETAPHPDHPFVKDPQAWKRSVQFQEMFFIKGPVVCDDIEHDPRIGAEFREYLMKRGRKKFLAIPMFVLGEVRGFIGIQHVEGGAYRAEEIELAQALAHHVMMAAHSAELAEQRRHAVVLEERTRMARDIHDTLAQGFTGVIVQLDTAVEALRDEEPEAAAKHIRQARELARDSLSEARRSVHALRPQALEKAAFPDALKAIIKNTAAGTSLRADFQLDGEPCQLEPSVEENLLHIGQEALTNALKHAHATEFRARLSFDSDGVRLELHDNGDGFIVDAANGGGFGLIGMKERAEQIGATLKVLSEPGAGTDIVAVSQYQHS
jgi:PAS domain S-box-containing protein